MAYRGRIMITKHSHFIKVLEQYEGMIYHLIYKLNIIDRDGEFYQIGLIALYETYRKYKGRDIFGKLAYMTIHSRLIDELRKQSRVNKKETLVGRIEGYTLTTLSYGHIDPYFWKTIKEHLTAKQWTYVQKRYIEDKTIKTIALEENTTIDAVKYLGKEVKKKLRIILKDY